MVSNIADVPIVTVATASFFRCTLFGNVAELALTTPWQIVLLCIPASQTITRGILVLVNVLLRQSTEERIRKYFVGFWAMVECEPSN